MSKEVALELIDLSFGYNNKFLFQNLNFRFEKGKVYGFSGPSGIGKTTLCRILAGQLIASSGQILLNGVPIQGSKSKKVILVNQENDLFPWQTVQETIQFFMNPEEEINELLNLVSLKEVSKHYPKQLSGGMKKRLSLCRALSVSPTVLILDELFSSQDSVLAKELFEKLSHRMRSKKHILIIVSHDQTFLQKYCDEFFSIPLV